MTLVLCPDIVQGIASWPIEVGILLFYTRCVPWIVSVVALCETRLAITRVPLLSAYIGRPSPSSFGSAYMFLTLELD